MNDRWLGAWPRSFVLTAFLEGTRGAGGGNHTERAARWRRRASSIAQIASGRR